MPSPLDINCAPSPEAQFPNGFAIIESHAMSIFPNRSAFFHSSEPVMSVILRFTPAILSSTTSITALIPSVISGIISVIPPAIPLKYGDNRFPKAFSVPSIALCISVNEPFRLSSIVSAIPSAASFELPIAVLSLL